MLLSGLKGLLPLDAGAIAADDEIGHTQRPCPGHALRVNPFGPQQPVSVRRELRMEDTAGSRRQIRETPESSSGTIHRPQIVIDAGARVCEVVRDLPQPLEVVLSLKHDEFA